MPINIIIIRGLFYILGALLPHSVYFGQTTVTQNSRLIVWSMKYLKKWKKDTISQRKVTVVLGLQLMILTILDWSASCFLKNVRQKRKMPINNIIIIHGLAYILGAHCVVFILAEPAQNNVGLFWLQLTMCHKSAKRVRWRWCSLNVVWWNPLCVVSEMLCFLPGCGGRLAQIFKKDPCVQCDCSQTYMAHIQPFRLFWERELPSPPPSSILHPPPPPPLLIPNIACVRFVSVLIAKHQTGSSTQGAPPAWFCLTPIPPSPPLIFICICINDADNRVVTVCLQNPTLAYICSLPRSCLIPPCEGLGFCHIVYIACLHTLSTQQELQSALFYRLADGKGGVWHILRRPCLCQIPKSATDMI